MVFVRFLLGRSPARLEWVAGRRNDGRPAAVLRLEDAIRGFPFRAQTQRRFVVTARHERLLVSRFGDPARRINDIGAKGHGRTLTCLDRHGQPLAALSYHLHDEATVLLVTAIAVVEPSGPADQEELSGALAGVLLCYLALAAGKRGLPQRLGFAPPREARALALLLGFRPTRAPAPYAAAGSRYMEWIPARPLQA